MADEAQKPAGVINPADTKPVEVKPDVDPSKAADAAKPGDKAPEASADKPDSKADEVKPKDAAGAPESYDLKVPEKSLLSEAHVESLKAYAKEKGYSNADAQSLLEREHNAAKASIEGITQKAGLQSQEWLKEAKADKDIGGEKFQQTIDDANKGFLNAFQGAEDLSRFMVDSGLGNHPKVLKFFSQLYREKMKSDTMVHPNGQQPPKRDPVRTMYDHPTSQQKS